MSIRRTSLAAGVLAVGLAATAYTAQAVANSQPAHQGVAPHRVVAYAAPAPHTYGADGMRMGLHCGSKDMSLP
jgi:hypothetical protein